jgi:hypothetical protein
MVCLFEMSAGVEALVMVGVAIGPQILVVPEERDPIRVYFLLSTLFLSKYALVSSN